MVSNECVELIQSETLKMLNKMYSTTTWLKHTPNTLLTQWMCFNGWISNF